MVGLTFTRLEGVRHGDNFRARRTGARIEATNASGNTPVVFIHGLWLLPVARPTGRTSSSRLVYAPLTPDWQGRRSGNGRRGAGEPGRPRQEDAESRLPTTGRRDRQARAKARRGWGTRPADCSPRCSPAVGSRQPRLPSTRVCFAASCAAPLHAQGEWTLLLNPRNRGRAIPRSFDQFKYGWTNALDENESAPLRHLRGRVGSPWPRWPIPPQPVDRVEGRHEEPRSGARCLISRGEGPGSLGDRQRHLQAAEAQPGRHRDQEDAQPRQTR